MRIPKQFFFHVKREVKPQEDADNYFSFNAATEEAKDDSHPGTAGSKKVHPLVPRLNLPRQDPNEEWREIMAQQQSYDDVSSSNQQPGSSS